MTREITVSTVASVPALASRLEGALANATSFNETRHVLPPDIGARLALETMIAVARMAPVTEERPA